MPVARTLFGGTHSLHVQSWAPRELLSGSVNADGWGVAWSAMQSGSAGAPQRSGKARRWVGERPLWQDASVEAPLGDVSSPSILAAVRNATPGIPPDRSGIPPLVSGPWSFVLNGFVPAFRSRHMRALREALSDARYGELSGASDTETLFLRVLDRMDLGAAPGAALAEVAAEVLDRVGGEECQLTMVLSGPGGFTAWRGGNRPDANSLYLLRDGGLAPGGVLLASEPLDDDPAWAPVGRDRSVGSGPI